MKKIAYILSIITAINCNASYAESIPTCSKTHKAVLEKATKGDSKAQYELAGLLFKGECSNGADTFDKWLIASAEKGHLLAAQSLWVIYQRVTKEKKYYDLSIKYLTAATQQGNNEAKEFLDCINKTISLGEKAKADDVEAWYAYGELLTDEPNNNCSAEAKEGYVWLKKAVEKGHVGATRELGRLYLIGRGVEQDMQLAITNLTAAAQKGDVQAMEMLAFQYTDKEQKEMYKWYLAAAEKGSSSSQYFVGKMYLTGKGVGVDKAEGIKWLKIAASKDVDAQAMLAEMYLKGEGIQKNCAEAKKYYELVAASDSITNVEEIIGAMKTLGLIHSHNPYKPADDTAIKSITDGCMEYDLNQAEAWYLKALNFIDKTSNYYNSINTPVLAAQLVGKREMVRLSLSSVYLNEKLNPKKGLKILKELAETSNTMRGYYLTRIGLAHYYGNVGPVDYNEAVKWLTKAALEGEYSAQVFLVSMYGLGKGVKKDIVSAYVWSTIAHANGGSGINDDVADFERTMKPRQIEQAQAKAKKLWKEIEVNKEIQAKRANK